jgi:hypothetical protein
MRKAKSWSTSHVSCLIFMLTVFYSHFCQKVTQGLKERWKENLLEKGSGNKE